MAMDIKEGSLPHIWWIDLKNDGVYTECAVMKRDHLGNVSYFPLNAIDSIDKRRLQRIVTNRNAKHFELWDLMSNLTLNNGVNALEYFHQLVHVLTPSGRVMRPQQGVIGVGAGGVVNTTTADARALVEANTKIAADAAASAAAAAAVAAITAQQAPVANAAPVVESAPAMAPTVAPATTSTRTVKKKGSTRKGPGKKS